jgi:two-component system sensor histidine kinase DegS
MSLKALASRQPATVAATPREVIEQTNTEYETIQRELKEIEILVKQSTSEVEKLAQRNAQLTNRVRAMEANIDTIPRHDMKELYNAYNDAQMRLFMMRGQVEQLQSRQENLRRFAESLRRVLEISSTLLAAKDAGPASSSRGERGSAPSEGSGIVKIINAQESERQSLANQLHDGPAQSLTNLILQAEICERLFDNDANRARTELSELKQAVTDTFQKVREFIFDLRPMMLDDLGLTPTLRKSVEDYEQKHGLSCNLRISGRDQRLPPHIEVTVFRVIQQLLKNIKDHANATHVQLGMDISDQEVKVIIEDDGGGFDVQEAMAGARQRKTIGLMSIQEQLELLGGHVDINSALNKGTTITFRIPVA